ncbi:TetR/AcrR family transcriptional regulator [Nocardia farcinica]|uniref:TetR/AcrR family transcriptional regulator n=1 Tax=Nocardia farcinica TaxID=37329 RepID=UPI001893FCE5|nr:TetR/AcrR family transcriptional regulator [Nocardia farcinica]MBF6271558.1 TetR/AcrR family transcriptional regulator C-terminal domain-containing protein [Nocardia farcinica]MCZ9330315.1 TetR/AcrR family transcriptional regulator [Nocardia farcinica]
MPAPSTPHSRGRQPRLDADATVEVALKLLNEVGLEALTMRRVGAAVDAQASALYRYFATKHDLLTAMAERMLAGCGSPVADAEWPEQVTELAHRLRAALLRYREGAQVFAGTHSTGPNTLGFSDALIGVLRRAGFADEDAARGALTIVYYTLGQTLEEQAVTDPAEADRLTSTLASGAFTHLTATRNTLTSTDFGSHFNFGLRVVISGLRAEYGPDHSPSVPPHRVRGSHATPPSTKDRNG